jgi:hypothetical protein
LNPVRWRYLSAGFLCISLLFLAATLILPQQRYQQKVTYEGPELPYTTGDTVISGYYIPTVEAGSTIRVSFSNFIPGALEISIFPTQAGNIAPSSADIIFIQKLLANQSVSFKAVAAQPYGMYVVSHNRTSYVLRVDAVYSPYDWLGEYAFAGVSASLASAILLYYYNFTAKRWRKERDALRDALRGSHP